MFDTAIDSFIDACESYKIDEWDYEIAEEGKLWEGIKKTAGNIKERFLRWLLKLSIAVKGVIEKLRGMIRARRDKVKIPKEIPVERAVNKLYKSNETARKMTSSMLSILNNGRANASDEDKGMMTYGFDTMCEVFEEDYIFAERTVDDMINDMAENGLTPQKSFREVPIKNLTEKLEFCMMDSQKRIDKLTLVLKSLPEERLQDKNIVSIFNSAIAMNQKIISVASGINRILSKLNPDGSENYGKWYPILQECVDKKDAERARWAVVNAVRSDPSFLKGYAYGMTDWLAKRGLNIYQPFDKTEPLVSEEYDKEAWTHKSFILATQRLRENFCNERIEDVRKIGQWVDIE